MDYKDYYKILGVPRTASQAEIKKAFRKLAREHHPDVKPGDNAAERRFKDVNEANAVLSDPGKRKQYDTLGANWEAYSRAGGGDPFGAGGPFAGFDFSQGAPSGGRGRAGNVRYEFRTSGDPAGFSDFFRTFFAGGAAPAGAARGAGAATGTRSRSANGSPSFEEILGELGIDDFGAPTAGSGRSPGTGGTASRRVERPGVVEAAAELGLEECFHGTTRIVEVGGRRLEVTIPRGVDNGSRIRLKGRGPDGQDLYVVVKVRPHPVFTRRGPDLERELPITLQEALLGGEVPVTTLRGRVLLRIPAGTQSGRSFRLKGQGMPRLDGSGDGDLYVKVRTILPATLSDEARDAARTFLELVDQPDPRSSAT